MRLTPPDEYALAVKRYKDLHRPDLRPARLPHGVLRRRGRHDRYA